MVFCFSDLYCSAAALPECRDIVPYTSYANGSDDGQVYRERYMSIKMAAENCSDTEEIIFGACSVLFPRCVLGDPVYLCRQACMGKAVRQ